MDKGLILLHRDFNKSAVDSILKNKITKNNNNFDKNIQIKGMLKAGILIVGILLLGMVVETYLSPNIIKVVISKFYM